MKKKKRLMNSRGFTLIEVVVTTLVMVLVALGLSVGTQGAIRAYNSSLFLSESELLINNLDSALGDLLHFAEYRSTTDGVVRFDNADYGVRDAYLFLKDGSLYLSGSDAKEAEAAQLINRNAYTTKNIESFTLQYNPATKLFSGSYVLKDKARDSLERERDFIFRTLQDDVPIASPP